MPVERDVERPPRAEPVFNSFRRQPLRPFYSLREFQIGLVILAVLGGVTAWVVWRGGHPDPHLFVVPEELLPNKGQSIPVYQRPLKPWAETGPAAPAAALDPFPAAVLADGWRAAAPPQMFDESNLYSKIDGRESFYKSYGFNKLHLLSLTSAENPGLNIDLELFDLGEIANALGALAAEISAPDTEVALTPAGLWYATRNSGFLSQGRYYARMIGSDDHELIRQKIAALKDALVAAFPGETMPWVYELFVGGWHISPARIQYHRENAFSFGFANDFYAATVPGGETEVFLSRRNTAAEADELAGKLAEGFAAYGQRLPGEGPALFKNEYGGTIDGVQAHGAHVIGVRLAPSVEEATRWLNKLSGRLETE